MLTSFADDEALFDAVMGGAAGYVPKVITGHDLISAVREVAAGHSLIDPAASAHVLERLREGGARSEHEERPGRLTGEERQILDLQPFLADHWRTRVSEKSGVLLPETPTVLVLYREDCRFVLDQVIPRREQPRADFDLVLASQPFRLRAETTFKAGRVLAPLARALRPGGRLLGIHSAGHDPGHEIVRQVWPDEDPFTTPGKAMLDAVRAALGAEAGHFTFAPASGEPLRYQMHTLPDEIDSEEALIGTSTLLAAWNAATYVAQIEDERLAQAMSNSAYLDATRAVLRKHGALWFDDESYLIVRVR